MRPLALALALILALAALVAAEEPTAIEERDLLRLKLVRAERFALEAEMGRLRSDYRLTEVLLRTKADEARRLEAEAAERARVDGTKVRPDLEAGKWVPR